MLPLEIAAWMQETITDPDHQNPLSMVYTLPGKVKFNIFVSKTPFPFAKDLFDCMFSEYKESVVQNTLDHYERNVALQTIYYGTGILDPQSNAVISVIIVGILFLLAVGIILSRIGPWKVKIFPDSEKIDEQCVRDLMTELSQLMDKYHRFNNNSKAIDSKGIEMSEMDTTLPTTK